MTAFAFQLYSARNHPPLAGTLNLLARLGYDAVEGYETLFPSLEAAVDLREALDASGLRMQTAHVGLSRLEADPDGVLEIAAALGLDRIYVPAVPQDLRPASADGYRALGARIAAAGAALRAQGLGFGWHNHDWELQPLDDGTVPLAALFEGGPELEWEVDIAWIVRGGADPLDWMRREARRITAVHLKDVAPVGTTAEGGWADVGHGTLDWPALLDVIDGTAARHFVVEHDDPDDVGRMAERSIETLTRLRP